ncbi:motility associated factor glycosyltransferase family protein [Candidatus Aerophobetes bacterium]|nr:motility associated factor glycosyltransferase family protein [Candidatus Aerophobetes bacterium]
MAANIYKDKDKEMNFYTKNIAILKQKDPYLAEKIKEIKPLSSVEIIQTKIGLPTLKVRRNGNEGILLHSAYDPFKEARNLLSAYNLKKTRFLIVLGFGMGYHIREVLKSYSKIKLILIIEPNIALFKKILSLIDLSDIFLSPKIKLIAEDNSLEIERRIRDSGTTFLIGKSSLISHPSSFHLLPDKFKEIKKAVKDSILWSKANLTTNVAKGVTFQKNILTNLPQMIKNPGIKNIFGKFKNKPVICVAAGPSLDKNVHLLKQAKNKAFIICVDAALRIMLQHKIRPDIVISIDFGGGTRNLFNGIMEKTEDLFLATDPEVYPEIISDFKGKKFAININKPLTLWLNSFIEDKGFLQKGASVAHTAFSLAKAVGGNPIILIGQDLSYPGGFSHGKGATYRKKMVIGKDKKTGKEYLLIKGKKKWIAKNLIMVEDVYGNKVPTDEAMYSYLRFLEGMIEKANIECIDATEGGAKIRGTKIMKLQEAMDKYCRKDIEIRKIMNEAANEREEIKLKELKKSFKENIIKLNEINFWAKQGKEVIAKLLREIKKKQPHLQERDRLMRESNHLKDKIMGSDSYLRKLLEENMYPYLYLIKRKENLKSDKTKKIFLNQIKKAEIFYDGFKKASRQLSKDFQNTLERLEKEPF